MTAQEALEMGLINRVVPDAELREATRKWALEIAERGPLALAGIKSAFLARHGGVAGLGRVSHDLLLKLYLKRSEEHTSELQSLMRISYAVFCLKKKNKNNNIR